MPTLNYSRAGRLPIIDAVVQYSDFGGVPHPSGTKPNMRVRALIDTGATHVVLSPHIISALGLNFHAHFTNTVVGGTSSTPAHTCELYFGTAPNGFLVTDIAAIVGTLTNFDIIVGWDAMCFFDWTFHKNGDFSQSW